MKREVPKLPRLQVRMEQNPSFLKLMSVALLIVGFALVAGYRSGDPLELMQKVSTPRCGEQEVLPPEALLVLDFVRQHGVTSIALSKPVSANRFLTQPITESIYPSLVLERGAVYVSYVDEPLPEGCKPLRAAGRISIAACR